MSCAVWNVEYIRTVDIKMGIIGSAVHGIDVKKEGVYTKTKEGQKIVYVCTCVRKRESDKKQNRKKERECVSVRTGTEMDHQRLYLLRSHA